MTRLMIRLYGTRVIHVFLIVYSYFMVKVRIDFVFLCELNMLDWRIINF